MRLFLLSLFFFTAISARSQSSSCTLQLQGRVLDADQNPLAGAFIKILEIEKAATTDQDGNFILTGLCDNSYTFSISFLGYAPLVEKMRLRKSEWKVFQLSDDQTLLSEVVVQDHYDHISESQSTSVLSGRALDATRGKALGAALREITGVNTIQSGPAIFKPVIHGVHSQRILMLNNGVRHEGQQWGAEHAPEIDPLLASNIVVVKDASAIKYGTDALGGVVIINPAPLPVNTRVGGTWHSSIQSNGRSGILAGIVEGASKQVKGLSWRTHGSIKKSGDFHTPSYSLTNTGFSEINYSAALGFHKDERAGVELFYSHFSTQLGILKGASVSSEEDLQIAFNSSIPQYTDKFSYALESPRQEVAHNVLKATAHVHRGMNTYSFQYAMQQNQRKEFDLRRSSLAENPAIDLTLSSHTLDLEWEREPTEKTLRCIGINALLQQNSNNPGTKRLPFIPNYTNYSSGAYLIQKVSVQQWKVEGGARFDYRFYTVAGRDYANAVYKSSLTFANLSATLGATRKIKLNSAFTTGLSTAWRPPHVAELYSIGTHQSAAAIEYGLLLDETTNRVREISEVNFKNEKAVKWVNTYHFSKGNTQLEWSAYANYIFNYLYLKPEGITKDVRGAYPYFRYRQTDASFLGIDALLEQALLMNLHTSMKVSILSARDQGNHDYFIYIPSNRMSFSMRYEHPLSNGFSNGFIEAGINYVTKQHRAPRVVSVDTILEASEQGIDFFATDKRMFDFIAAPSAYLLGQVSGGSSIKIGEQKLDIRFTCENLFNKSYREYTNRLRYFSNEIGRNFGLALNYNF